MVTLICDWMAPPKLSKDKYSWKGKYSRVQKSIENWPACRKMALGEVGVSLP